MEHTLLTARLTRSRAALGENQALEFVVEEGSFLRFVAGQFLSVREPRGDKFVTRAYSIASPPAETTPLTCVLTALMKDHVDFLCDREIDETARFHGPHGLFVLKPEVEDVILVATGTGVAPFRSMVSATLRTGWQRPACQSERRVWLVYGTRYRRTSTTSRNLRNSPHAA